MGLRAKSERVDTGVRVNLHVFKHAGIFQLDSDSLLSRSARAGYMLICVCTYYTGAHAQQEVPSMRAHLVRILVSLPDRAGAEAPAELHPSVFAANLSRQLLLLTSRWHLVSPPTSHLLCSYSHPGGA